MGQLTSGIQSMSSMIPGIVLIKLDDDRVWRTHVYQVLKSQVLVGADASGRDIDCFNRV